MLRQHSLFSALRSILLVMTTFLATGSLASAQGLGLNDPPGTLIPSPFTFNFDVTNDPGDNHTYWVGVSFAAKNTQTGEIRALWFAGGFTQNGVFSDSIPLQVDRTINQGDMKNWQYYVQITRWYVSPLPIPVTSDIIYYRFQ